MERFLIRLLFGTWVGLLVVLLSPAAAMAVEEFPLPTPGTAPAEITVGPDGALWFTESAAGKIGRITTAGEVTNEYATPAEFSDPQGITAGPDGALWFTEAGANKIGRISTTGDVTEYDVTTEFSEPRAIAEGPDGALWFTESRGHKIGRITTAGVVTNEYPTDTALSGPLGITAGPGGALWFTEANANQIGRIDPTTGDITEFPIPTGASEPAGIATGPDGALWFTEASANQIGRLDPTRGDVTEFPIPTDAGGPAGITEGPDGALWFTEAGGNAIGRITTDGAITEFPALTAFSGPQGITAGPDGALWFTERLASQIGRHAPETEPPEPPTLSGSEPASPANNNSPRVRGTAAPGSTVDLYTSADCSGVAIGTGSASDFASTGLQVLVDDDSTTTFRATATNSVGTSACSSGSIQYVEDSTPPATPTLTATDPSSPSFDGTPLVKGTVDAGVTAITIYRKPGCAEPPAATIGSAAAFTGAGIEVSVAENAVTAVSATASDAAGNQSGCSERLRYRHDSIPPSAPVFTGTDPASPSSDNSPTLSGTAEARSTVRLYTNSICTATPLAIGAAGTFASTGIQVSVPDNSTTAIYATATDAAGNVSACTPTPVIYVQSEPAPASTPGPSAPGPAAAGGSGPAAVRTLDTSAPTVGLAGSVARMDTAGVVRLSLSCPASEPGGCSGTLSLETADRVKVSSAARRKARRRKVRLGRGSFQLGGSRTAVVRVRLSRRNRRLVRKLKRVRVRAIVAARDQAGNARTTRTRLTLRAPRRKRGR